MWGRKSPIEEYLDKHPDSTLREYNEYVKEEERKRRQEKVDSDNRHKALLKSYIGKCFKINFNGMSTMFFRLTSDPTDPRSSRIEEDAYSVYIDSSKVHMELEKKRYINVMWLPGQEEWYGNSHKVFQISEEDFNKVVEKYNEMVKVAKEIKATQQLGQWRNLQYLIWQRQESTFQKENRKSDNGFQKMSLMLKQLED